MIDTIKTFFNDKLLPLNEVTPQASEEKIRLAIAALMLEVAESDFKDQPEEKAMIKALVETSFELNEKDTNQLLKLAEEQSHKATDDYEFTRLIDKTYSYSQKTKLIENLWRVAYADNKLSEYEEQIIRRIAGLIHVSHKDFIEGKLRVAQTS